MIHFRQYRAEDILNMNLQPAQKDTRKYLTDEQLLAFEDFESYTFLDDNKPIFCGGAVTIWEGRASVWCFMNHLRISHLLEIHRYAVNWVKNTSTKRLEMYVDCDFVQGHKWARMLGFKVEAERMRSFVNNGKDHTLYSRIKGD